MKKNSFLLLSVIFSVYCLTCVTLGIYKSFGLHLMEKRNLREQTDPGDYVLFGDLYSLSGIKTFKEEINIHIVKSKGINISNCEIINIGDSFSGISFKNGNFSQALSKKINKNVFFVKFRPAVDFPLYFLKSANYHKTDNPKYLILETVERISINRINTYNRFPSSEELVIYDKNIRTKDNIINDIKNFFLNNQFSFKLTTFIKDLRFSLTEDLDPAVGTYSCNPPNLFVTDEINFNRQLKQEHKIENFADSIEELSEKLNKNFNITLIYLIIPNKYTIYHEAALNDAGYDNFIPRLQEQLRSRNVNFIDIYSTFVNFRKANPRSPLYFKSDTHYNSTGRNLLVSVAAEKLNKLRSDKKTGLVGQKNLDVSKKPLSPEEEGFNEQAYLFTFPDVLAAVRNGAFSSGLDHYLKFGRTEKRLDTPQYSIIFGKFNGKNF
jgi:hypothetical protein